MAEYIEKQALIDAIYADGNLGAYVEYIINRVPTADVRPVVLCRDCCHRGECAFDADDNFFCASGERNNCGADMREVQSVD